MVEFLRMDTLGDIYITPRLNADYEHLAHWVIQGPATQSRIRIYKDGRVLVEITYPKDVSPWSLPMGDEDPTGTDVVGNGGWPTDREDSCSRTDTITWINDGGFRIDVAVRTSTIREDVH